MPQAVPGYALQPNGFDRDLETQQYARCGMTMNEVRSVLGPPRAVDDYLKGLGIEMWNYGEKCLKFQRGVVVAISNDSYVY
jgi:hypothetical protein